MQSSQLRKRASLKSGSHERFNIDTISGMERSPQKSFIYEGDLLRQKTLLTKREKIFVQLPKIYPLHQKLLKIKTKDIEFLRFQDKRFHLKGSKLSGCESQDHAEDSTLQSSQKLLTKQLFPTKKNQSRSGTISNDLFYEIVLRANDFNEISLNKNITKIKAYVEQGNNSRLIKQLLRRRSGIKVTQDKSQADFVWTRFSDWQSVSRICKFNQTEGKKSSNIYHESEIQQQADKLVFAKLSDKQLYLKRAIQINEFFIHNHLKNHEQISDKKNLFKNVKAYCAKNKIEETTVIPKTYHVQLNQKSEGVILPAQLLQKQKGRQNQCFYIVKPGQDTNRGTGISVVKGITNVEKAIQQLKKIGKSSLIQQYIDPLLFKNRKFDIRCYALVTTVAGKLSAYWYKQGYLRTCSKQFSYDPSNIFGHLTNDAVQKKSKDYGKYEQCNKLSYNDLETILQQNGLSKQSTISQMKRLATLSIKSVEDKLQGQKNIIGFQVFGYDFLIDKCGKVWLIQINTNPCLQFSGSLLSRIIWHMIQNSFRIVLDPFIEGIQVKKDGCRFIDENKYQRII